MDEEGFRWRKVAKLVGALYRSGLDIDPRQLTERQWAMVAGIARVRIPSEATRRLVIETCTPWIPN